MPRFRSLNPHFPSEGVPPLSGSLRGGTPPLGKQGCSRTAQRMFQRFPRTVLRRAGDALSDKVHAIDAVGNIGVKTAGIVKLLPTGARYHILICRYVNIGKGFKERLWVAARKACRAAGQIAQVRSAGAGVHLIRLAIAAQQHLVRLFLMPFQCPLGAVNLDPEIVFPAMRNLRRGDGAQRPVVITNDSCTVIVKRAAWLEYFQVAGNLLRQQSSDEASE